MDIFYALNIADFATRVSVVGLLFLIYVKLLKKDKDIIRSRIFLKYEELRSALGYVLILSPLFLVASVLEHPLFRFTYGEESVHLVQDIFLIVFQVSITYFLAIVYKTLKMPGY